QAQSAQRHAGQHRRQAERDQDRREQRRGRIGRHDPFSQRGRENARDRGGRGGGGGNGEGEGAPERDDGGEHGGGGEGRRDTVSQIGRERTGEDQQRIGQSEGDGQDAGGASTQYVIQRTLDGGLELRSRSESNCWIGHALALAPSKKFRLRRRRVRA